MKAPKDVKDPATAKHRRKPNSKALSPEERRSVDALTCKRLARHGLDGLPATETLLVDLEDETRIAIFETREKALFAQVGLQRASAMALSFDHFSSQQAVRDLRHFCIRPKGGNPALGELADGLRRLSGTYDQVVGRLVKSGAVAPILAVVHLRFDKANYAWDVHMHVLLQVAARELPKVFETFRSQFAATWVDKKRIRNQCALANYILSEIVNYKDLIKWPNEALVELFQLERPRLARPAGRFADHRRSLKGKQLTRAGDQILVRDRAVRARHARQTEARPDACERVVAIVRATVRGRKRLCAVVKTPRVIAGSLQGLTADAQPQGPSTTPLILYD